jgi:tetratricopeptide (TPR) repeat protein
MGQYISIKNTPERLHPILESRYSGFSAWEAFRLNDFDIVGCHATKILHQPNLELALACRAMELVGLSCYHLDEFVLAAQTLETVSMVHATHPICQLFLAESLVRTGQIALGLDLLCNLSQFSANDAELLMLIAGSYESLGIAQQALELARRACGLEPQNGAYLIDLSYYTVRTHGINLGAIGLAWQAVNLEPEIASHRVWLATLHNAIGEPDKAYAAIKGLSKEQIATIDCDCCLDRLAVLFTLNGCLDQAEWCQHMKRRTAKPVQAQKPSNAHFFSILNMPATVEGLL